MIRRRAEETGARGQPSCSSAPWCPGRSQTLLRVGLAVLFVAVVGGCAQGSRTGGWVGTEINIPEPVEIKAGSARAWFQGGRQVSGVGRFEPYCELEINSVSQASQWSSAGSFRVVGERYALLQDSITRIPALVTGISCSDPLFQESIWRLAGPPGSNVRSLRCIAPYFDCRIGPPLSLPQAQAVTGPRIRIPGF
jgi:hypothetical protein